MPLHSELEADSFVLLMHLRSMVSKLRNLPDDKWDWTLSPPAPTPRILAVHTLQWLQCDRQHINNPDVPSHRPVPEAPTDPAGICRALEQEANNWEEMLKRLTPADLDRDGHQFGQPEAPMTVRNFIYHMIQNVIYKNGQFATIYFALGLDGEEPYDAPFPNPIYKEVLGIG